MSFNTSQVVYQQFWTQCAGAGQPGFNTSQVVYQLTLRFLPAARAIYVSIPHRQSINSSSRSPGASPTISFNTSQVVYQHRPAGSLSRQKKGFNTSQVVYQHRLPHDNWEGGASFNTSQVVYQRYGLYAAMRPQEVSIPHRQSINPQPCRVTGAQAPGFQYLIGSLSTDKPETHPIFDDASFNTSQVVYQLRGFQHFQRSGMVSIPHRQSINRERIIRCKVKKSVSIPHRQSINRER